jgi:SSS family solute:Na+ symporter
VLLNLLPIGFKGLSFAALTAAVVASLAGKANSISTIFTLDIYKNSLRPQASEKQLVWVGRLSVVAAMGIALGIAPFLGIDKKGRVRVHSGIHGICEPGHIRHVHHGFPVETHYGHSRDVCHCGRLRDVGVLQVPARIG